MHGETDDFSYNVVKDPVNVHDLHATLLQLLGIQHDRLTFRHAGPGPPADRRARRGRPGPAGLTPVSKMPRPNPRRAAGATLLLRTSPLWIPLVVGACSTGADLVQAEQAAEQAEIRQAGLDALEAAAAAGDLASQMRLASMYYDGRTVPRDRGRAAVWYRAAADQGLAEAYYSLGIILEDGDGLPQDAAAAVAAYRVAAEAGVAEAQTNLGLMALRGEGMEPDLKVAYLWLSRAAELGVARAQFMLGP